MFDILRFNYVKYEIFLLFS